MMESKIFKEQYSKALERIKLYTRKTISFYSGIFVSPLFYIPFFLKLIVGSLLASSFATELFIPFISYFVDHPFNNPYQAFLYSHHTDAFPYPFGMLAITSFFYFFAPHVGDTITPVSLLLLRLPLLVADIGILSVLLLWLKQYTREILILYWMSPILFYITYVHGQLDVIPIALLFISLFFISRKKDIAGLTVLGLACATKTSIALTIPLFFFYLLKERERKLTLFLEMLIPLTVFLLVNLPVLFSSGFFELVFKSKEQFKVLDLVFTYTQNNSIYIVPFIFMLLVLYFARLKRYSRNIFIAFLAISFSLLLLAIPPHQGWYFWVVPFVVYLYVQLPPSKRISLYLLSIVYFLYFAVVPSSDFIRVFSLFEIKTPFNSIYLFLLHHGLPGAVVVNLAFTLLQASLLFVIYTVFRYGFLEYTRQKLYYKPFVLGIAGDSGSGKSTLAEALQLVFSSVHTTVLQGDDMHKWERGHEKWKDFTHLDPLANNLHAEIETLRKVKQDEAFTRKMYDHGTGNFVEPKKIVPKRLVIFEGLHAFFLEKVRKSFDLRVYVSPEEQVRLHWKVIRDSFKRGYSKEEVFNIVEQRRDDSASFISVQQKHADIVFSLRNRTSLGDRLGDPSVSLDLSLFITCPNDVYVEPFLRVLGGYLQIEYAIFDTKQNIKVTGTIEASQIQEVASLLIIELDDITNEEPVWKDGYEGVMQLFVVYYLFETLKLMSHGDR